jgi:hypothetical protein
MLATLVGWYKVKANWVIDHIDLTNRHWKNKCFIISSWWQKIHFLLSCQFRFVRLSLVSLFRRYHPNTLIRKWSFNFQSLLLSFLSIGMLGWINTLYIESTENLPFLWRFQRNTFRPSCKRMFAKRLSKAFKIQVVVLMNPLWTSHSEVKTLSQYHLCDEQYYTMWDIILKEWSYQATYPPRT